MAMNNENEKKLNYTDIDEHMESEANSILK